MHWHAETATISMNISSLKDCAYIGDWERAMSIIDGDPEIYKEVSSAHLGIEILVCAQEWGQLAFFNKLVQLTNAETLKIPVYFWVNDTILHYVARLSGSMNSARALVEKCPSLIQAQNSNGFTPLHIAIHQSDDSDLVWYLMLVTTSEAPDCPFTDRDAGNLLYSLLAAGYYGAYIIYSRTFKYHYNIYLT